MRISHLCPFLQSLIRLFTSLSPPRVSLQWALQIGLHTGQGQIKVRTKDDKCREWVPECNLAAAMQRRSNGFPARKGEGTVEMAA